MRLSASAFGLGFVSTFAVTISLLLPSSAARALQAHDSHAPVGILHRRFINSTDLGACQAISGAFGFASASRVMYPTDSDYGSYIGHYMSSSSQTPACVVLPKSAADLSAAIKIVGSRRVRFAISSGGHASNKGFSSTLGVHITLKGFQQVNLSKDKSYVDVGPANVWDNVYQALEGTGRGVVGGRVSGVGVGGFILGGGGFSWITNQYGLTVDTLLSADLVLPNGTLTSASATKNPDLFWAIKGGGNRFGVIYNFRLKTVPQGQVYGGIRTYTTDQIPAIINATYDFVTHNKDTKAQVIPAINSVLGAPPIVNLLAFYDSDSAAQASQALSAYNQGQAFALTDDWKPRSMSELAKSMLSNTTQGLRGTFHTVSLERYSLGVLNVILQQCEYWGSQSLFHSAELISFDVEPFLPYSQYATSDSAWPHKTNALPLGIYFAWSDPSQDDFWLDAIKQAAQTITDQAKKEGQNLDNLYLYTNYAALGTPSSAIYGPNLDRLTALRKQYDPKDVMGLTTYFSF